MERVLGGAPLWWDRDSDPYGKPIRSDVRMAAYQVWDDIRRRTRYVLGDSGEAAALLERSIVQVSRYLDRRETPLFSNDTSRLLKCAFGRALRRAARKLRRIHFVGDLMDLDRLPSSKSSSIEHDWHHDARKAANLLGTRARKMHELRKAGFEWKEVAALLNTTDAAARAEFSRALKQLRAKLASTSHNKGPSYEKS